MSRPRRESTAAFALRHDLYELAVTNALPLAGFLFAVHQRAATRPPITLREDFSGTAALARGWLALNPKHRAIAIDRDPKVLERAIEVIAAATTSMRLTTRGADVFAAIDRADILAATNFPLGYFHTRDALLAYLRHARRCLKPRGIFAADMYGGTNAFEPCVTSRTVQVPQPSGSDALPNRRSRTVGFRYHWEQAEASRLTNLVTNYIHFELPARTPFNPASRVRHIRNAFKYHWRLWSIPELRDALLEAGFASVEVYTSLADGIDQDGNVYVAPLREDDEIDDPYVAYMVGHRTSSPRHN